MRSEGGGGSRENSSTSINEQQQSGKFTDVLAIYAYICGEY